MYIFPRLNFHGGHYVDFKLFARTQRKWYVSYCVVVCNRDEVKPHYFGLSHYCDGSHFVFRTR